MSHSPQNPQTCVRQAGMHTQTHTHTYTLACLMPCVIPYLPKRWWTRASHVPCNPDAAQSWCNSCISQLYTLMKGLSRGICHMHARTQTKCGHEAVPSWYCGTRKRCRQSAEEICVEKNRMMIKVKGKKEWRESETGRREEGEVRKGEGRAKEGEEKQDKQTTSFFCSATVSGHCGLLTWLTWLHLSSILESAPLPPLPFYGPSWLLS